MAIIYNDYNNYNNKKLMVYLVLRKMSYEHVLMG